ncbi:DUF421 domain-containing protein [Clostridiaceae bacterium 35-E11]
MKEWMKILIRSIGLFFLTFAAIRVMGKRQLAKMLPFHVVNYMVIAIIAALISANIIKNFAFGLISFGVWILFSMALDYGALKSKWVHDLINGKETVLIKSGKVMEENLKQMRLTGEELLRELRSKNAFQLADVEFAVMEATGELNVLLKADKKTATPSDLGQIVAPQDAPQTIILDGNILDEPLSSIGLNRNWLNIQLESMGISLDNVFIAQVDASGDLYIDLFDDSIQISQPKVKEMLYANLEKSQADLLKFSLDTEDETAKMMYGKNAEQLQNALQIIEPYLLK